LSAKYFVRSGSQAFAKCSDSAIPFKASTKMQESQKIGSRNQSIE